VDRLATFASCFECRIWAVLEGEKLDARDREALRAAGLEPTSQVSFRVAGGDAEQARQVLDKLVKYQFYVEDAMGARTQDGRGSPR